MDAMFFDNMSVDSSRPTPPVRKKSHNMDPLTHKSMTRHSMRISDDQDESCSNSLSSYYHSRFSMTNQETVDCPERQSLRIEDIEEMWNNHSSPVDLFPTKIIDVYPNTPSPIMQRKFLQGARITSDLTANTSLCDSSITTMTTSSTTASSVSSDLINSLWSSSTSSIQQWFDVNTSKRSCNHRTYLHKSIGQSPTKLSTNGSKRYFLCFSPRQRMLPLLTVVCLMSWSSFLYLTIHQHYLILESRPDFRSEANGNVGTMWGMTLSSPQATRRLEKHPNDVIPSSVQSMQEIKYDTLPNVLVGDFDTIVTRGTTNIVDNLDEGTYSNEYMGGFNYNELRTKVTKKKVNETMDHHEEETKTEYKIETKIRNLA
jgi:hypothetical protein